MTTRRTERWWTVDTIFVFGLGAMMALFLGGSFFVKAASVSGSALVPAALLQRMILQGQIDQTVTDDQSGDEATAEDSSETAEAPE